MNSKTHKIKNFYGPFNKNDCVLFNNGTIIHVGINVPFRPKYMYEYKDENNEKKEVYLYKEDLTIETTSLNGTVTSKNFCICEKCILEIDNLAEKELKITFLKNMPEETNINIVYDD